MANTLPDCCQNHNLSPCCQGEMNNNEKVCRGWKRTNMKRWDDLNLTLLFSHLGHLKEITECPSKNRCLSWPSQCFHCFHRLCLLLELEATPSSPSLAFLVFISFSICLASFHMVMAWALMSLTLALIAPFTSFRCSLSMSESPLSKSFSEYFFLRVRFKTLTTNAINLCSSVLVSSKDMAESKIQYLGERKTLGWWWPYQEPIPLPVTSTLSTAAISRASHPAARSSTWEKTKEKHCVGGLALPRTYFPASGKHSLTLLPTIWNTKWMVALPRAKTKKPLAFLFLHSWSAKWNSSVFNFQPSVVTWARYWPGPPGLQQSP